MEEKRNPWQIFMDETPEVAKAYQELIRSVNKNQALDEKTKFLILIGIYSTLREEVALRHFIGEAFKAGARKEEVQAAALLAFSVGVSSAELSLPLILDALNKIRPGKTRP